MLNAALKKLALAVLFGAVLIGASSAETIFLSTQLRPIEEAQKVREVVLKDFAGEVSFVPEDTGPFLTRIKAEAKTGKHTIGVVGALHGDLPPVVKAMDSVEDVMARLRGRKIIKSL